MSACKTNPFDTWKDKMFEFEGGLADHPNDYGGLTNRGITIGLFKNLAPIVLGIPGTSENLRKITVEQAIKIAKWHWDQTANIEIDAIRILATEGIWGSGHNRPIQWALQSIGIPVVADGVIGPITSTLINQYPNPVKLYDAICEQRVKFFNDIVKNDPSQKVFLVGWLRRVNEFNTLVKQCHPPKKKAIGSKDLASCSQLDSDSQDGIS